MNESQIRIPPKLVPLFSVPRGGLRHRASHGGRGSGKSFTFAKMAAIFGYAEPLKILCTRELQVSIKDSFYAELVKAIKSEQFLFDSYEIGENYIRSKVNDTRFLFKGLRHNIGAIKSTSGIDICIIEEAEDVSEAAFLDLEPTIREPKSEIWTIWNPKHKNSPVDKMFRQDKNPPRSMVVEMNHSDNPWFPRELKELRQYQKRVMDPATYKWIWEGAYLENSNIHVFAHKCRVDDFMIGDDWHGPYYGMDFGFSQDPTAALELWIYKNKLFVRREAYRIGLEIDETADYVVSCIPGIDKEICRADNARPETISYLNRNGMSKVIACKKGADSVEDGIEFIKSFEEIIIHPSCQNMQDEAAAYSYKIDKITGEPTTKVEDKNNHLWDAARYALEPLIKNNNFSDVLRMSMVS